MPATSVILDLVQLMDFSDNIVLKTGNVLALSFNMASLQNDLRLQGA